MENQRSFFEREDLLEEEVKLESLYMDLRAEGINLEEKIKHDSRWKS